MNFAKYHALGNDYVVVEPVAKERKLDSALVRRICDRHTGLGSDGLILGPLADSGEGFSLRIYNPDGSEAEISGNGLRIFARYLWDRGQVGVEPFALRTPARRALARVHPAGEQVTVEMGSVSFHSQDIPLDGPAREVLNEEMEIDGQTLTYSSVSIGNPHCVIFRDRVSPEEAKRWGPKIERESRFLERTNVQFAQIIDRENLRIEIWERGVGYTMASGSSSCAAAAVAHRLDLVGAEVEVHQPGGMLRITLTEDLAAILTGPVAQIADGVIAPGLLLAPNPRS